MLIVNREIGEVVEPAMIDRVSGRPLSDPVFRSAPGPAADEHARLRHTRRNEPLKG
ncbi:hypothetical protein GGD83_004294 [Rhodoblastus sphagnicola]|uniref:hypothetical protein n=1 Tax=Rhodoblastus sphagnicola TaxID=333368 RepID=UPI00184908BA|nr:hypothetical protein [Rhodoblastus sphagnicola]MBB4200465.1 hypothetical protein [Rhodoblastus sphagnicola]